MVEMNPGFAKDLNDVLDLALRQGGLQAMPMINRIVAHCASLPAPGPGPEKDVAPPSRQVKRAAERKTKRPAPPA